jgi:glutaredoxin
MKTSTLIAALFAAALLVPPGAAAQTEVYRWVDKDGKVHFTDTPPAEDATSVTAKRMGGGGEENIQLPFATREAMRRNPVTYYTSPDCADECSSGRSYLTARGIPFAERNATNKADADVVQSLVGALVVPILTIGGKPYKGFNEETWNEAFDNAGYPRTRLPNQANPLQTPPPAPAQPPAPQAAPGTGG